MKTAATDIEDMRRRLGPVGVWMTLLGTRSAAEEREAVAEIEDLGYGSFWFGETPLSKEAFAHAAILLAAGRSIVVATGIASIYARDAVAMANGGRALADAYPGRFLLGIGVTHAQSAQARGQDYRPPVTAMRAYLDAMDAASYLPPAPAHPPPRMLAALRRQMLELARDRSDGAHPYLTTPGHTARARELLGAGALVIPEQGVVLETDSVRARERARTHLSRYLGLPNYLNSWRAEGFDDADFAGGGSDRLVDAIVAWGDPGAIAGRVADHLDAGADHVAIQPIATDPARGLAELRELAPALLPGPAVSRQAPPGPPPARRRRAC